MIAMDIKRPEHCRECPAMNKNTKECNLTGKLTPEYGRPEWCRIIEEDEIPTIEPEDITRRSGRSWRNARFTFMAF